MHNIMYHFVGRDPSLKGISLERFKSQLDFLQKTYPNGEIAVTFDHGTIDHFEYAAPELERRNMRGIFFILTMVQEEQRIPLIDKQRYLEALYRTDLVKMMCTELRIDYDSDVAKEYQKEFDFYSLEERYLRYLRDRIVSQEDFESFIGKYFRNIFGDQKAFAAKNYLNWKHIAELQKRGHVIGSHSHYHVGDRNDFERSLRLIEERIKIRPECISYPNGVKRISDENLKHLGIKRAYISTEIDASDPYRISRIDCNLEHSSIVFSPLTVGVHRG